MRTTKTLSILCFFLAGLAAAVIPATAQIVLVNPGHDLNIVVLNREDIAYLGVRLAEVNADIVRELKLPEERGARVVEVEPNSPADQAGLKEDDVIVGWNAIPVDSARQLRRLVWETPPGRTVRLRIIRNGKERTLTVQLGRRKAPAPRPFFNHDIFERWRESMEEWRERFRDEWRDRMRDYAFTFRIRTDRSRLGVTLQSLTDQLAAYFGLKNRKGALVVRVWRESPADHAGLKAGDIILAVDGTTVTEPGDVVRALRDKSGETVKLRIWRDKREQTLEVKLPARDGSKRTHERVVTLDTCA